MTPSSTTKPPQNSCCYFLKEILDRKLLGGVESMSGTTGKVTLGRQELSCVGEGLLASTVISPLNSTILTSPTQHHITSPQHASKGK